MIGSMHPRKDLLKTQLASLRYQVLLEAQTNALTLGMSPNGERENFEVLCRRVHRYGVQRIAFKSSERHRINSFTEPPGHKIHDIYLNRALHILRPPVLLMAPERLQRASIFRQ